jgi:uncharacterized BrkB/YihY/UPF0761 family membrane protein
MSLEALTSLLVQFNWVFLAGWILLLGAAFAVSFPERPVPARNRQSGSDRDPLR